MAAPAWACSCRLWATRGLEPPAAMVVSSGYSTSISACSAKTMEGGTLLGNDSAVSAGCHCCRGSRSSADPAGVKAGGKAGPGAIIPLRRLLLGSGGSHGHPASPQPAWLCSRTSCTTAAAYICIRCACPATTAALKWVKRVITLRWSPAARCAAVRHGRRSAGACARAGGMACSLRTRRRLATERWDPPGREFNLICWWSALLHSCSVRCRPTCDDVEESGVWHIGRQASSHVHCSGLSCGAHRRLSRHLVYRPGLACRVIGSCLRAPSKRYLRPGRGTQREDQGTEAQGSPGNVGQGPRSCALAAGEPSLDRVRQGSRSSTCNLPPALASHAQPSRHGGRLEVQVSQQRRQAQAAVRGRRCADPIQGPGKASGPAEPAPFHDPELTCLQAAKGQSEQQPQPQQVAHYSSVATGEEAAAAAVRCGQTGGGGQRAAGRRRGDACARSCCDCLLCSSHCKAAWAHAGSIERTEMMMRSGSQRPSRKLGPSRQGEGCSPRPSAACGHAVRAGEQPAGGCAEEPYERESSYRTRCLTCGAGRKSWS